MPFLWVLPLALYLLSFIWSFAGRYKRKWHGILLVPLLLLMAFILHDPRPELMLQIPIFGFTLYYCSLVCHGELYRSRPAARFLTTFYLYIATGGALGGIFVAVIAPLIFRDYFELQWLLAIIPFLLAVIHWREGGKFNCDGRPMPIWKTAVASSTVLALLFWMQARASSRGHVGAVRNFYGVLKLYVLAPESPYEALALYCGTTLHGFQLVKPGYEDTPAGYYHENTGIGLLRKAIFGEKPCRMGVVGLGAGALATYGRTNDVIRFYEINPKDIHLARERFSFLSRSRAQTEVVLGDARLSMERESPQEYDLLALDAFNSDAVPIHLLTREALLIYERHLKPGGAMAVHISSKHLNLAPVVEGLCRDLNFHYALIEWEPETEFRPGGPELKPWQAFSCRWMLISRNSDLLSRPEIRQRTVPASTESKPVRPWTDDYSSLLPIVRWK
jgi:hypothetical protein